MICRGLLPVMSEEVATITHRMNRAATKVCKAYKSHQLISPARSCGTLQDQQFISWLCASFSFHRISSILSAHNPCSARRSTNVGWMLMLRHRQWANIQQALDWCIVMMGSTRCQPSQPTMMAWFRRAGLYLLVPHGSPNFLWSIPPNFCDTAPVLKHLSSFYIPTFYIFYIPTLNPNVPKNYRPLTLSSTHSELIEMLIMPKD